MTKILFLLPPSEGKNKEGNKEQEQLTFSFEKPKKIALGATEKDLKCTTTRYAEGMAFNKACVNEESENYALAIERYTGVMYDAIGHSNLSGTGRAFFENSFVILSGMYGLVRPIDTIGNYKLPIETKGLREFWGDKITESINNLGPDCIVSLLPLSYQKMIDFEKIEAQVIHVDFYTEKDGEIKKMTHGVKGIKGNWIRNKCEQQIRDYKKFGGDISEKSTDKQIYIDIVL